MNAAQADADSPVFPIGPGPLFSLVSRLVREDRSFKEFEEDVARMQISFVAVTSFLRFKDDVDIAVVPAPGAGAGAAASSHLAIYSRSRVGYSDLGANAKRVTSLIEKFAEAASTT
ncbi:MAG: DUF1499 domain-containing protein [Pseudomonadota bacterium]